MNIEKRRYRMVARADAARRTGRAIIDAAAALFWERDPDEITLEAIAARAGVTLQTVLRRFGSKDAVFAAAAEVKSAEIARSREPDDPGDRAGAMRALFASYEQMGEVNWRLLRFEHQDGALHQILVDARALHRDWVARTFAELLPRRGAERERRIDALFTATDFYVWKLSRRDLGRSRAETEANMLLLVDALVRGFGEEKTA
jgi:AcrR family transcriptional regulator